MKLRLIKIATALAGLTATAAGAVVAVAQLRWDRTFEAPYPALRASSDPAVIARGEYLAYGPGLCVSCHTPNAQAAAIEAGAKPPLIGGHEWVLPLGTIRSPNLTPDSATGIGRRSDAELARMLRHMVRSDGRAGLPFMAFQNLSDEDLVALISFLRAQPAAHNPVPQTEPTLLGKVVLATLVRPAGPSALPPSRSPAEAPTVERGEYLANRVADCAGCHTRRNMVDGSLQGPRFSGGATFPVEGDPSRVLVSPNLTPDPETGHIARWTEEQFVARFRAGKAMEHSFMPWAALARMSDADLRAVYRYLQSLEPVRNETGPLVQPADGD